jgi:uroporphyrinogen decarboxylase
MKTQNNSIYAIIPDLIEAGFDIINPVQTNCRNMDPAQLKADFGRDITFWGGGGTPPVCWAMPLL